MAAKYKMPPFSPSAVLLSALDAKVVLHTAHWLNASIAPMTEIKMRNHFFDMIQNFRALRILRIFRLQNLDKKTRMPNKSLESTLVCL